jgi:hypothetical protein
MFSGESMATRTVTPLRSTARGGRLPVAPAMAERWGRAAAGSRRLGRKVASSGRPSRSGDAARWLGSPWEIRRSESELRSKQAGSKRHHSLSSTNAPHFDAVPSAPNLNPDLESDLESDPAAVASLESSGGPKAARGRPREGAVTKSTERLATNQTSPRQSSWRRFRPWRPSPPPTPSRHSGASSIVAVIVWGPGRRPWNGTPDGSTERQNKAALRRPPGGGGQ